MVDVKVPAMRGFISHFVGKVRVTYYFPIAMLICLQVLTKHVPCILLGVYQTPDLTAWEEKDKAGGEYLSRTFLPGKREALLNTQEIPALLNRGGTLGQT